MLKGYKMTTELVADQIVGFTRTPACDHTHCPYSGQRVQLHGHFRLSRTSNDICLFWAWYTEETARQMLGTLNLAPMTRSYVEQAITDLFRAPPDNVVVLPRRNAA